jgi:hypothetical protein
MVLGAPVEDALGRVLINAGEELTEELIHVLIRRGFGEVVIRPAMAAAMSAGRSESGNSVYDAELGRMMAGVNERISRSSEGSAAERASRRVTLEVLVERLNTRMRS